MKITKAESTDIDQMMEIVTIATKYMCENGNPNQWINGYPSAQILLNDVKLGRLYKIVDDDNQIIGQFMYEIAEDPTYKVIDGEWINNSQYGVIHRLASRGTTRGVAKATFDWCFEKLPNLRVDTHADNKTMITLFLKNGFTQCGEIILENGSKRTAFQKCSL